MFKSVENVSYIEKKSWKIYKDGRKDLLQSCEITSDESPHIPFASKKISSKIEPFEK